MEYEDEEGNAKSIPKQQLCCAPSVKDVFPILENIDENKPRGLCQ
jgi:hypothetical protein